MLVRWYYFAATSAVEALQNVIPKFTHEGNFNGVHVFGQCICFISCAAILSSIQGDLLESTLKPVITLVKFL